MFANAKIDNKNGMGNYYSLFLLVLVELPMRRYPKCRFLSFSVFASFMVWGSFLSVEWDDFKSIICGWCCFFWYIRIRIIFGYYD